MCVFCVEWGLCVWVCVGLGVVYRSPEEDERLAYVGGGAMADATDTHNAHACIRMKHSIGRFGRWLYTERGIACGGGGRPMLLAFVCSKANIIIGRAVGCSLCSAGWGAEDAG
jgi:hypothetical protein